MMRNARRFALDELILSPGTYFNPQTEIMVVVDDSPEVDHEIFEGVDLEASDWVQISEETPLDEHKRDDLVERFQLSQQSHDRLGEEDAHEHDEDEDELDEDGELDEDDEDDELDELDDDGGLGLGREHD